jgi:hypothetical protein
MNPRNPSFPWQIGVYMPKTCFVAKLWWGEPLVFSKAEEWGVIQGYEKVESQR